MASANQRVAFVTGGASGIGLSIVRRLAVDGLNVFALDRNADACHAGASAPETDRDHVIFHAGDVGNEEDVSTAITAAVERFGRLDVLCNNAAVHPIGTVEEQSFADWRAAFRVNLDGTWLCSKAALPHLRRATNPSIVNISSISGLVPYASGGAYAASKAAIVMLTKVLAVEAGADGIRVNCICPGEIRHRRPDDGNAPHIPLGRRGRADEVASTVAFLASAESSYMTGNVLVLDGGTLAGRPRP